MATEATETIGYIGLGIMGCPAAANLIKAGYAVNVWARRGRATTAPLLALGATECPDLATLAGQSSMIITNVSDTPDMESLMLSSSGIGAFLQAGQLVIDMSTISPTATVAIAEQLGRQGVDFLDAPVSGGQQGAIDGTLTFMVGGKPAAVTRATPVLEKMGKTITHIGESGAGQVAKMCNQIIIGATLLGVAEAFHLASSKGVDLSAVRQALQGGFAGSRVLDVHAQRMIDDNFTPGFKAHLHKKDIDIALSEGQAAGLSLASANHFAQKLSALIEQGEGELDSAAIYRLGTKLNSSEPSG